MSVMLRWCQPCAQYGSPNHRCGAVAYGKNRNPKKSRRQVRS